MQKASASSVGPGSVAGLAARRQQKHERRRRCGLCLCVNVRRGSVFLGLFDTARAFIVLLWFVVVNRSPKPGALGYGWAGQLRASLLPEACVTVGEGVFLVYGAARRRATALLVAMACMVFLAVSSLAFFFVLISGAPYYGWMWLPVTLAYMGWRVYNVMVVREVQLQLAAQRDDGDAESAASDAERRPTLGWCVSQPRACAQPPAEERDAHLHCTSTLERAHTSTPPRCYVHTDPGFISCSNRRPWLRRYLLPEDVG